LEYLKELKTKKDSGWLSLALHSSKDNVSELSAISVTLRRHYKKYASRVSRFNYKPPCFNHLTTKDVLINFYEVPPAKLKLVLKERRNDHGLTECPYCGNPFVPDTLDHFLPKDYWAEFSIFPNNLVPQCRGCAPIKGAHYFCETDKVAKFIHPMYEGSLARVGFKIEVTLQNEISSFEISLTSLGLTAIESDRVRRHFKELNVKERIRNFCVREFKSWKVKAQTNNFDVKVAFEQRLAEDNDHASIAKNWKIAFYIGMLKNGEIIDYLNSLNPKRGKVHSIRSRQDLCHQFDF
jgi:5-methylcytosine-specific restriction endonuclease McrA